MHIKLNEQHSETTSESDIYDERFLLDRPLLKAIRQEHPPVLLIDEIDRSDEAFEAFLLEILSEFTVTIPELGKISASSIPIVILTSNGTRELSDALRRRCLFHYADYPSYSREIQILTSYLPDIDETLLKQVARFVQTVREWDIAKRPGIAETLDWARALSGFDVDSLVNSESAVTSTLSCLLKTPDDQKIGVQQIQDHGMNSLLARSA
jgi:MoxR-like ATPase